MRVAFYGVPAVEIDECCRTFAVLMAAAVRIGEQRQRRPAGGIDVDGGR